MAPPFSNTAATVAPWSRQAPTGALGVRGRALAAFAATYLIWGSTYLAIRYGVATIPPYLMTGVRCLVAGGALYAWSAWRGEPRPARRAWGAALGVGSLLFVVGQGVLSWAETRVASGAAALLIATIPLWMVLLAWWRPGGAAPTPRVWAGIGVGLVGVLALMGPGAGRAVDPLGGAAILLAALSWSAGSVWARGSALPASRTQSAGMQLSMAGAVLVGLSLALGETSAFSLGEVSARSVLALGYLIVFGSIVAFSAYLWLLDHSTPARVGSHAYVNPLIAVLIGALAGDGALTGWVVVSATAVVAAVMLTLEEM
jgi:drug/metabolite transporter (DMT)-like permease